MINVLLAISSELIRKSFLKIVLGESDMRVCGEAKTDIELFELALQDNFDVIIMDIDLIGRGALETLGDLRTLSPHSPVIVLSSVSDDKFLWNVFKAGASGLINKETEPKEFLDTIRRVAALRPSE
ncbi:MAG: response regulator transcription factor [Ignavibacteriales bacterium]